MKNEMVNQTTAILAPSLVVSFGDFGAQHDQVSINVFNYSAENIARDFSGELFISGEKIGEKKVDVIVFCGSHSHITALPTSMYFQTKQEYYDKRQSAIFKYSYYDRTGKIKFSDEITYNRE